MLQSARRLVLIGVPLAVLAGSGVMLAGCAKRSGELVVDDSVGVTALRTACPSVGVPVYTGDVTVFNTPGATDAAAIDVVAALTDVRATCSDAIETGRGRKRAAPLTTGKVSTQIGFDVLARRSDTRGARSVTLPYFTTVVRGGSAVIAKRVGTVTVTFADGQARASAHGTATAFVDRSAASLPESVRDRLERKRRAGSEDAAVDPLAQPDVRSAIARASFEVLVGFQLDDRQLTYNATR